MNKSNLPPPHIIPAGLNDSFVVTGYLKLTRKIIFTYLWVAFLIFQASFTTRNSSLIPFINDIPQADYRITAIANFLVTCILLLFLHSSYAFLKNNTLIEKINQYFIALGVSVCATVIYYVLSLLYFRVGSEDWFLQLWYAITALISFFSIYIVFPFFGRAFMKGISTYSLLLMANEAQTIIQELKNKRLSNSFLIKSIDSRNKRFWLYFDSLILAYEKPKEEIYSIFLGPAGQFFQIQYDTRHAFNREKLLDAWNKFLISLESKISTPLRIYTKFDFPDSDKSVFIRISNWCVRKLESSNMFANEIEHVFPHLRSLWNASFMPVKNILLAKMEIDGRNEKKLLHQHVEAAKQYDLIAGENKIVVFFGGMIILTLNFWFAFLQYLITFEINSSQFWLEVFRFSIILLSLFLLTNSGLRILQRKIRSSGVSFIVSPWFYVVRKYFFFCVLGSMIFFAMPTIMGFINQTIKTLAIVPIINILLLFLVFKALRLPNKITTRYADSLLIRELLILLAYIEKSKKFEFRLNSAQSLNYCKKLFLLYGKLLSSSFDPKDQTKDIKIFIESVNKYFDRIKYEIRLGSDQARLKASGDVVVIIRAILSQDLHVIQEEIHDINLFIKEGLSIPRKSTFAQIVFVLGNSWIAKTILSIIIYAILNHFAGTSIWEPLNRLATILEILSR